MKKFVLFIAILCSSFIVKAANIEQDTTAETLQIGGDSVIYLTDLTQKPHSPHRATIYAMVCPGLGQIYNKQWYKVPILYAGIAAAVYGLDFNVKYFKRYKNAYSTYYHYLDSWSSEPGADNSLSYAQAQTLSKVMPYLILGNNNGTDDQGQTVYDYTYFEGRTVQDRQTMLTGLKNKKDKYRRNRDLLYLTFVGIYAVQIIDACVYAHFYDFEINDDLSMHIRPASTYDPFTDDVAMGLSVSLKF